MQEKFIKIVANFGLYTWLYNIDERMMIINEEVSSYDVYHYTLSGELQIKKVFKCDCQLF